MRSIPSMVVRSGSRPDDGRMSISDLQQQRISGRDGLQQLTTATGAGLGEHKRHFLEWKDRRAVARQGRLKKLTGRAGLGYVFDNGIAPYISYATSFDPVPVPTTGQLLEPTTGKQIGNRRQVSARGLEQFLLDRRLRSSPEERIGLQSLFWAAERRWRRSAKCAPGRRARRCGKSHRRAGPARRLPTYMDTEILGRADNGKRLDNVGKRHGSALARLRFGG